MGEIVQASAIDRADRPTALVQARSAGFGRQCIGVPGVKATFVRASIKSRLGTDAKSSVGFARNEQEQAVLHVEWTAHFDPGIELGGQRIPGQGARLIELPTEPAGAELGPTSDGDRVGLLNGAGDNDRITRRHRRELGRWRGGNGHYGLGRGEKSDQRLCGSFSTIQVWPLATSFWRSGVLPDAAASFCSTTALSKVGAGSS